MMVVYIVGFVIVTIIIWLMLAPVIVEVDSRVPFVSFRWLSIGSARLFFEDEWKLKWRILIFRQTHSLSKMGSKKKIVHKSEKKKTVKKVRFSKIFKKFRRVLRTFRVRYWQLAVDTGDDTLNARLYPLNYLPHCQGHLLVNFGDENYIKFRISNRPIRILWAWIK
jgi:hypothetical protein